ncbi:hypothetical protein [Streptomyces sp. B15]|uniref:hypothetical protein n=1 Tax=Streptomyces sp. B15 TaxID=1537797 RepID=UPI001B363E3F|nr:hypothetical protein [Streptomyces sp. B15]MBQ1122976.1 hypothetical protein [Streptomyces sp. B15]
MAYHLRYFFEAGVPHTPLWPGLSDLDSPYGFPCELERLPLSTATRNELERLCEWYQSSIGWEYPPDPSPWTPEQWTLFRQQADAALETLRCELGDDWIIEDRRGGS